MQQAGSTTLYVHGSADTTMRSNERARRYAEVLRAKVVVVDEASQLPIGNVVPLLVTGDDLAYKGGQAIDELTKAMDSDVTASMRRMDIDRKLPSREPPLMVADADEGEGNIYMPQE